MTDAPQEPGCHGIQVHPRSIRRTRAVHDSTTAVCWGQAGEGPARQVGSNGWLQNGHATSRLSKDGGPQMRTNPRVCPRHLCRAAGWRSARGMAPPQSVLRGTDVRLGRAGGRGQGPFILKMSQWSAAQRTSGCSAASQCTCNYEVWPKLCLNFKKYYSKIPIDISPPDSSCWPQAPSSHRFRHLEPSFPRVSSCAVSCLDALNGLECFFFTII